MSDPISPPVGRRPEEVLELVSLALSDGDLEAALAQYERGAVLQPWADGTRAGGDGLRSPRGGADGLRGTRVDGNGRRHPRVSGNGLRDTLTWFMALRLPLSARVHTVLPSADGLALVLVERQISGVTPGCERVRLSGLGASMVRRQRDGAWRIVAEAWFLAEPAERGAASPRPQGWSAPTPPAPAARPRRTASPGRPGAGSPP
jgi:hypothetical protein